MSGEALAAAERIRRRPEFERVYDGGTRVHGRFMTVFVLANAGTVPRLGVAATRKIGSAVERNRAKRLAREVFRRHKMSGGVDIVIVPRREMLDAPFANLESDYLDTLERCVRAHHSPSASRRRRDPRRRAASRV